MMYDVTSGQGAHVTRVWSLKPRYPDPTARQNALQCARWSGSDVTSGQGANVTSGSRRHAHQVERLTERSPVSAVVYE